MFEFGHNSAFEERGNIPLANGSSANASEEQVLFSTNCDLKTKMKQDTFFTSPVNRSLKTKSVLFATS